ncbi:MAG: hypothetical protein ACP5XB_03955 [Isosphaeraceae bacterium]
MAEFARHTSDDWCHICGTRQALNVDIWYPKNAEHERVIKGLVELARRTALKGEQLLDDFLADLEQRLVKS